MNRRLSLRKKMVRICGSIAILSLLGLIFFQLNAMTSDKTLISDYSSKITELSITNENLEMSFLDKNDLDKIETVAKELNFEKTEKVSYIKILESTVAVK